MYLAWKTHLEREKVHQMRHLGYSAVNPWRVICDWRIGFQIAGKTRFPSDSFPWIFLLWGGKGEYIYSLESTSTFTATSSVDKPLGLFTHSRQTEKLSFSLVWSFQSLLGWSIHTSSEVKHQRGDGDRGYGWTWHDCTRQHLSHNHSPKGTDNIRNEVMAPWTALHIKTRLLKNRLVWPGL